MRRWRGCVALAIPAVTVLLWSSVAGATATEMTSLPWGGSGVNPAYTADGFPSPAPEGTCNLKEVLPIGPGGSANDEPWGFSIACQAAVRTDSAADLGAHQFATSVDLPGATCGTGPWLHGSCAPDPQGYIAQSLMQDGGYGPSTFGGAPVDHCLFVLNTGGSSIGNTVSSGCVGGGLWDEPYCTFSGGDCVVYGNPAEEICGYQSFDLGTTGTVNPGNSDTYYPLQFRVDCVFTPHSGDVAIRSSGNDISDCDLASDAANASMDRTDSYGDLNMTVDSTCVAWDGNREAAMPDHYWVGGSPNDSGACSLVGISPGGATLDEQAGHTYHYDVTWTGSADYIIADPEDENAPTSTAIGSSGISLDLDSDAVILPATGSPQEVEFTPTKSGNFKPYFWCVQGSEGYEWGTAGGVGTDSNPSGGSSSSDIDCSSAGCWVNLGECLDTTGIGLDPITWVPGLVRDTGCLFSWAFIPASISTSGLSDPFTTTFPGTWVTDGADAFGTIYSGFDGAVTATGAPQCDAPAIDTGGTHDTGHGWFLPDISVQFPAPSDMGCSGAGATTAGDLFGYRGVVRDSLVFLVWVAALWAIWHMMPWVKNSGDDLPMDGKYEADGSYEYEVK